MFDDASDPAAVALCRSGELVDGGAAVPFDLRYAGQTCTAFAVRFEGRVQAYLNRCTHVAMELGSRPDRVFDDSGRWLLCHFHGAAFEPSSGACAAGPCRGGLVKIATSERDGMVRWHTAYNLQPPEF